MSTHSRFEFDGFALRETKDTATHHVDVGTIEDGGSSFLVTMLRNSRYQNLPFVVASIATPDGKLLWSFKKADFNGVGLLATAGDQLVVALVGTGPSGKVERVIPFSTLSGNTSPMGLRTLIDLKRSAAKFLDRTFVLSGAEQKLAAKDNERAREEATAAAQAAAERRQEEREARVRAMLARGRVVAYTNDGRMRHGIPVLASEWQSVSNGVHVILVDSISEDGTIGNPLEAFQIVKRPGKNPEKGFRVDVSAEQRSTSTADQAVGVKPVDTTFIERDNDAYEVQLFPSMDDIRTARAQGLNSGTYVAVVPAPTVTKLQVYAVHHDRIDTIGLFDRM